MTQLGNLTSTRKHRWQSMLVFDRGGFGHHWQWLAVFLGFLTPHVYFPPLTDLTFVPVVRSFLLTD